MDCCSKCPDNRPLLHPAAQFSRGIPPGSHLGGNNGVRIPDANGVAPAYNQVHPAMRYHAHQQQQHPHHHHHHQQQQQQHSIYRLGSTSGAGVEYNNVVGTPHSSAPSSNSPVTSSSSASPSPSAYHHPHHLQVNERYANYTSFQSAAAYAAAAAYGNPTSSAVGSGYANLNHHRLDMNSYYGVSYDNYNRYAAAAANFGYKNVSTTMDRGIPTNSRLGGIMGYGGSFGHAAEHIENGLNSGRYPHLMYMRNNGVAYDPHAFGYMHYPTPAPLSGGRGSGGRSYTSHHHHPFYPHFNANSHIKNSYGSMVSDSGYLHGERGGSVGGGGNLGGHQHNEDVAFGTDKSSGTQSNYMNGGARVKSNDKSLSHVNDISHSSRMSVSLENLNNVDVDNGPYNMRSNTSVGISNQNHSTEFLAADRDYKESKTVKYENNENCLRRHSMSKGLNCATPLESPTLPFERAETPSFSSVYSNSPLNNQNDYFPRTPSTGSFSPHSNYSSHSCMQQFSPKSVRRRPPEIPTILSSSSNFIQKNRVLECDFIPSKRSRKKVKCENPDNALEIREEIRDLTPLPGFQQAFGSTEIGRFSETFFNNFDNPFIDYYPYESDSTQSPKPWETGDSLEGPHYNLHIGATVVEPADSLTESFTVNDDSPIDDSSSKYFSEINCNSC